MVTVQAKKRSHNFQDITGQRFNRLIVLEYVGNSNQRNALWKCRCDCGNFTVLKTTTLRKGKTKSCGCLQRERAHLSNLARRTIAHYYPSEHWIWMGLRYRCLNPENSQWHNYGGRGITVCQRWRDSFKNFLDDMRPRPSMKHTLDRENNNGNYSCGKCEECLENGWTANCRWVTMKEQMRNTRKTIFLTFNGIRRPLQEWAEVLDIAYQTIYSRYRFGLPIEKILAPTRKRR